MRGLSVGGGKKMYSNEYRGWGYMFYRVLPVGGVG